MEPISPELDSVAPVHVVSAGPFGRAVARYLTLFYRNAKETIWDGAVSIDRETWPESSVEVVAAWRPVPGLCEFVDQLSRELDRPFIPLIAESPVLRLGPVIIPGTSGCWQCWELRSRQHAISPNEQSALWKFYDDNPRSGPGGYLEPFAMLGAAQIARAIHSCRSPQQEAGRIWQIDLFTREVSTSRLLAVNDCQRCGMKRSVESRTYLEAQQQLAFLWTQDRIS